MSRVKRGVTSLKHRRRVLKRAKGYRFARSKKEREAKIAIIHAGLHAFNDRRKKKRSFRTLWQIKINAAVRPHNLTYSRFINKLKTNEIALDRKILASLAAEQPATFGRLVASL